MLLEAKAANCFSYTFVLKVDGRPFGKFQGRWFGESFDVALTERRHLQFRKVRWLSSQFELSDPIYEHTLGSCSRSGVFTSSWDLKLSVGPGRLERAGWFNSVYEFKQGAQIHARVDRLGWCERGWVVDGNDAMTQEDLLLIGMVYQVIQNRQAAQASSSN
ncbi:MAG TPA: hypothetical protein VIC84_14645 [Blastocatellia bacterium]|jgi:hypothetical protein